jgi:hypothetical protein
MGSATEVTTASIAVHAGVQGDGAWVEACVRFHRPRR